LTNPYRQILIAVDFMPDQARLLERTRQLADANSHLVLLHVVEFLPMELTDEMFLPEDLELEQKMAETAHKRLQQLADQAGLPGTLAVRVETGPTKAEILRVAEEMPADLIVVGSHGRHGISRLLGSTAQGVVHGAPCDVLAVRVGQSP